MRNEIITIIQNHGGNPIAYRNELRRYAIEHRLTMGEVWKIQASNR